MSIYTKIKIPLLIFASIFFAQISHANTVDINASKLLAHVVVSFSPRSGSFTEGSTFKVPILLNTKNRSINGIEVRINYDKDKLSIVNPTGGTSIIGVWVEPPKFDNTKGTASYVGVVPGGITTESGLIGTITFMAKSSGDAEVSFNSNSKVLLNDGLGTEAQADLGRASYTILPKAPDGVTVFSETHPNQDDWYNNNNPVLSWVQDPGVSGFSFKLDNKPNTIPDNKILTTETTQNFEKLKDGLWYFHIKAIKNGVWGTTGHYLVKIDTTPPAKFKPIANYLVAAAILTNRTLVSFFTTDNLSGIDHYEVGVIDKDQPATESPVFVRAESPFQVPLSASANLEIIVRAMDKAGNVRDQSVNAKEPLVITEFIKSNSIYLLSIILVIWLVTMALHYLVGHHVLRNIRRIKAMIKKEEQEIKDLPLPPNDYGE